MQSSLLQRLDLFARALTPFVLTLLLLLLSLTPLRSPYLAPVMPSIALIAVYYWTVFRPDLMPSGAVFLIGLLHDLGGVAPLGIGVLALLAVHGAVGAQRRFFATAGFGLLWLAFAVLAAAAQLFIWLLSCAMIGRLVDIAPALLQYAVTLAIYPCLFWLFGRAQQLLLRDAETVR
ncbi:MAG: rod shape-determining protein MreD [Tistlia sp.]|uniref:rod shape-determining protein MreD n=1 Tax=Tistlia sp. TaxID=3057121 RepID=UPI0034A1CFF4